MNKLRRETRSITVGEIKIGSNYPIRVQTMANTDTNEIDLSVHQAKRCIEAGAELLRYTTQGTKEAENLGVIHNKLREGGYTIPLVADIHFNPHVAETAAKLVEKIRINPGNFAKDHEVAKSQFKRFIAECKKHGTAVRIGINHGSLGTRITELYGNTPKGMQEAMTEWVKMCMEEDFHNIVLSLKASNVPVMVEAYRLLNRWMQEQGILYPLHLGVTEAGNSDMGRIKSAAGLSALLTEGIGDTIRVSLTEPPVNEIPVARIISDYFSRFEHLENTPEITSNSSCFNIKASSHEEFIVKGSIMIAPALLEKKIDDFTISCKGGDYHPDNAEIKEFKDNLMQATRRRITKCEYIACPSCGRTLYDIETTFNEVKKRTSHLKGITIAVMGCIVNGPGEMADADYGYIGEGRGKVTIYRKQQAVRRSVPQEEAIDVLLQIIEEDSLRQ